MSKIVTAEQAVANVRNGMTITFPGNASILVADHLLAALEARFLETGAPNGLTAFAAAHCALSDETGIGRLAHEGMTRRFVCSTYPSRFGGSSRVNRFIMDNKAEAYCFPMGVLYSLLREAGAGRPGILTEVGVGTSIDPVNGGGKLNDVTTEDLIRRVNFDGEEFLYLKAPKIDVAFIKATSADADGNLSMEREPLTLGVMTLATAAKANGGKVFAQVERIVSRGSLHPKSVVVPGALVDGVVLAPEAPQSAAGVYNPSITGETRIDLEGPPVEPGLRRLILARAAALLQPGWLVNVGVGIGAEMPMMVREADCLGALTFSTEHGAFGGWPALPPIFGAHVNAQAIVDPTDTFNIYTGGVLDACFLGMAQVDRHGNVNVSKFGGRIPGVGGFIDISARTKNVFICGNFAGAADIAIDAGRLDIRHPGKSRKLVDKVEHITFSGAVALERRQNLHLVTERGIFVFTPDGWELVEIAPGVSPERDLQPLMDFPLRISAELCETPPEIFATAPEYAAWLRKRLINV